MNSFSLTPQAPCPYLADKFEQKIYSFLVNNTTDNQLSHLTKRGFRRSQNIMYRPFCVNCTACICVRVRVKDFSPSRSQRRILKQNQHLLRRHLTAKTNLEHYYLFRRYITARHPNDDMAFMSCADYFAMVENSPATTRLIEYREQHFAQDKGELVALMLLDQVEDGVSLVYSFYNPSLPKRSLGQFMILDQIELTRSCNLPHVYLGLWVEGSRKMYYKVNFQPLEQLHNGLWQQFSTTKDTA